MNYVLQLCYTTGNDLFLYVFNLSCEVNNYTFTSVFTAVLINNAICDINRDTKPTQFLMKTKRNRSLRQQHTPKATRSEQFNHPYFKLTNSHRLLKCDLSLTAECNSEVNWMYSV